MIHPSTDHITCFDVGWHRIYHAGVDLYNVNGSTENVAVRSIANGKIVYASANEEVIVIEHLLTDNTKVYSSYWHLQLEQNITTGINVGKGTKLGEVIYQQYSGRYPEFHQNGDDSHLHFEVRTFKDGGSLFPTGSRCNTGYLPGVGYTFPQTPNAYGYLDPLDFLRQRISSRKVYLPLISGINPSACLSGQNLAQNAGFEGSITNPQPWLEVTTVVDFVYHFVKDNSNAYYSGLHGAMLGDAEAAQGYGIIDEELIQSFVVPANVNSITWKQKLKLDRVPRGTTVVDPGDRFILSVKDTRTGMTLPILADIVIDHTAN